MKKIKGILMVVLFGASMIGSACAEGSTNTLPVSIVIPKIPG